MVVQVVTVAIRPEQRGPWLEAIQRNAASTRGEEGCESYRVSEDVEAPNTFVLVEEWRDLDAQYEHFRKPEFREMMAGLGDVLAGPPEVKIHEVAATQSLDEALAAAGVRS